MHSHHTKNSLHRMQMASSTNAVATGITEKLNQKRIDAAMTDSEEETLAALQLVAQVGEGGFAKVSNNAPECWLHGVWLR